MGFGGCGVWALVLWCVGFGVVVCGLWWLWCVWALVLWCVGPGGCGV